jgi:phage-related tail fiber protein
VQWQDPDVQNITVDIIDEIQTLADDQTQVDLVSTTTYGLAVYIEGVRINQGAGAEQWEPDGTIETRLTLGKAYPAGTEIYLVQNEPSGSAPAPLERNTYGSGDGFTTFNVPDLRGVFVRGLDDGRGIDSGRAIGTYQADDLKSHGHTGTAEEAGRHRHGYNRSDYENDNDGPISLGPDASVRTFYTSYAGDHEHNLLINNTGGDETRPKNVALLACIKY